uniref:Uncharacterized protein n=1 Tax=viral metagenome TaxID=1070528 RepID=A0A6M3LZ39_9ZZZZ
MEENEEITQVSTVEAAEIVQAQERASVDVQVSTAHSYPRNLMKAKNNSIAIATMDLETAKSCSYALPRAGKTITGPSVHLARILAQNWGNIRAESKIIRITFNQITSRAVAWDLETNYAVAIEVSRKIVDKYGKRYNDDMIVVAGNAINAISYRNAVLAVIPKSIIDSVYNAASKMVTGDLSDEEKLIKKRKQTLDGFKNTYGVDEDKILTLFSFNSIGQIKQDELVQLIGLAQAIKDGDTTVEDAFNVPVKHIKKDDVDDKRPITKKITDIIDKKVPRSVIKETIQEDDVNDDNPQVIEIKNTGNWVTAKDPAPRKLNIEPNMRVYTEDELAEMGTGEEIYRIIQTRGINPDEYPNKNTNKKLRGLILAGQKEVKSLDEKLAAEDEPEIVSQEVEEEPLQADENDIIEEAVVPDDAVEDVPDNPGEEIGDDKNKWGIEITDVAPGDSRSFLAELLPLLKKLEAKDISSEVLHVALKKSKLSTKYQNTEALLKNGSVKHINHVLNFVSL